ncbi:MAG: hypothetical protein D6723_19460 [Acidobacteria bacterium]|nr:MAG: hypothetical protein D6723_19460 [Acidobacteriota bacterium]
MNFSGTWIIVSSHELDEAHLRTDAEPHVTLHQDGDRIHGEYRFGRQRGVIEGRRHGEHHILFHFREREAFGQISGTGMATREGQRLILTLMHPKGDDITLECERRSDVDEPAPHKEADQGPLRRADEGMTQ